MELFLNEGDLPQEVTLPQAVEGAYPTELADVTAALTRGVSVLIECDRELAPFLVHLLRARLAKAEMTATVIDGKPPPRQGTAPQIIVETGILGAMVRQLRDAVRGNVQRHVFILAFCDLLTAEQGGLSTEAREVVPLLYENPEAMWLGFRDPSYPLPRAVAGLFSQRVEMCGVPRDRLRYLVRRSEARKLGLPLNVGRLHRHTSGLNALRLRKTLAALDTQDHATDTSPAWRRLRKLTLPDVCEVPTEDLDKDIGGYAALKDRLRQEVVDVLRQCDGAATAADLALCEALAPRGLVLGGPSMGKLLFVRALAGTLGTAMLMASVAELSERGPRGARHLHRLFRRARRAAPAVIVLNELDPLISPKDRTGRALAAQLLVEMDNLPSSEFVLVVGMALQPELLGPALLRPGRFELRLLIDHPTATDRRDILKCYGERFGLQFTDEALDCAVEATSKVPGGTASVGFSDDHLHTMCRALARLRLRGGRKDASTPADVDRTLKTAFQSPAPQSPLL